MSTINISEDELRRLLNERDTLNKTLTDTVNRCSELLEDSRQKGRRIKVLEAEIESLRTSWSMREAEKPPKRKVYQPPADRKPLTTEEVKELLEEGRRMREAIKPQLDRLSAPLDEDDRNMTIDGGGAEWRRRQQAEESARRSKELVFALQPTLHQFATKLGLKATDVLMFMLGEGHEGIHVNTKIDEELQDKIRAHFKKKEEAPQPTTSESLPQNAVESPHKQPPFKPIEVDRSRMVIDGGGRSWRDRTRVD